MLTWKLGNQRPGARAQPGSPSPPTAARWRRLGLISDSNGESRSASEITTIQVPLAVGLAEFSAAQDGSSSVLLLGVIAMALLALAAGFAWQKRTA